MRTKKSIVLFTAVAFILMIFPFAPVAQGHSCGDCEYWSSSVQECVSCSPCCSGNCCGSAAVVNAAVTFAVTTSAVVPEKPAAVVNAAVTFAVTTFAAAPERVAVVVYVATPLTVAAVVNAAPPEKSAAAMYVVAVVQLLQAGRTGKTVTTPCQTQTRV